MNASVIPGQSDVMVLAGVALVALLCIGIGVWTGARRVETALVAGWGLAGFVTIVAGTLTSIGLSSVILGLAMVGVGGLVRIATMLRRDSLSFRAGTMGRIAVLALPFAAGIASAQPIAWDDFSHWLPNLAFICVHDRFPSLARPSLSYHAAYPYGLALPGFAIYRLTGLVAENAALIWNLVVMLCAAASIADVIARRLASVWPERRDPGSLPWLAAALGLLFGGLAGPGFVPKIFLSNMGDAPTGYVLAVLLSMLSGWDGPPASRRDGVARAFSFAFACVALINLKQANAALFGLLIIGSFLAAWKPRQRSEMVEWRALAIAVPLTLGTALLWGHYAASQIPDGQFEIMPFAAWHWDLLPSILDRIAQTLFRKIGLSAVIIYLGISAFFVWRAPGRYKLPVRTSVIVSATVSVGMIGFLAFTYLAANFAREEAAAAASFWRYIGEIGPLAVLGSAAIVPLDWLRRDIFRRATPVVLGLTLVLPLAAVKFYRDDLTSKVPLLRRMAVAVDVAVPRTASLTLVDPSGNGFAVVVAYFELALSRRAQSQPARVVTKLATPWGVSAPALAGRHFEDGDYVWLMGGTPSLDPIFASPLSRDHSYLLKREEGRFVVIARWEIAGSRSPE